jgi:hypothetical protein
MHLLHRSSVFGANRGSNKKALLTSRSDSIEKRRSGGVKPASKRARLRAGLAAALQELRLAGRKPRADAVCCGDAAAGAGARAAVNPNPAAGSGGGALLPLLMPMLVLALACVVALGRAPAVCCCTCVAWCCCRRRRPARASTAI